MVAQPVASWRVDERGYPASLCDAEDCVLVGTYGVHPVTGHIGKRYGSQHPLWRITTTFEAEEIGDYDGVAAVALLRSGLWAVAYKDEAAGCTVHLLKRGEAWAALASWQLGHLPFPGRLVETPYGILIAGITDRMYLWAGSLRDCGRYAYDGWLQNGDIYIAGAVYLGQAAWRGPQAFWVEGGLLAAEKRVVWRGRMWRVEHRPEPHSTGQVVLSEAYAGGWVERARARPGISQVFGEEWRMGFAMVPAPGRLYIWCIAALSPSKETRRILSWDGRRLHDEGPADSVLLGNGALGARGAWCIASDPAAPAYVEETGPWLPTTALEPWTPDGSKRVNPRGTVWLCRIPCSGWIFSLAVDWGDGSGQHRPKLSGLRLDYRPSRRWDNEPVLAKLSVDWSDGSGQHKPKLDSLAVAYSDGSGEHRPVLASLSLDYEAEGAAGTEQPRLQRLQVEWALRRGWVGEGERVLVLKPIEAPEGEWWALHVHTNLTREQEEQCRLLVRAEPCDRDVDDWESYRTYRLGWRVYLPVAAGSVRVAVVGPDTLPDDVEVFAQFVR